MQQKTKLTILLICAWAFAFYEYMVRVSDSVIVPQLMQKFHAQASGLGVLSSSYYIIYVIMQIPAGLIADRFNLKTVLTSATFLTALGSFIFGSTNSFALIIIARLLMGVAAAFAFIACIKILRLLVNPKRLTLWIGVTMTIATLGAVCGQEPWLLLIKLFGSWQATYIAASIAGLALTLITFFLPIHLPQPVSNTVIEFKEIIKTKFKSKSFWLLAIYIGLLSSPITVFAAFWGVPFLTQGMHFSREAAASLMALSWVGGLFGGPLLGFLADYFNARKLILILIGLLAASITAIILFFHIPNYVALASLLFILGLLCNGNVIIFTMMAESVKPGETGFITGLTNMFNIGGGPVFQLLTGLMLSAQGGLLVKGVSIYSLGEYQMALILVPACLALSSLSLILIKKRASKSP